MSQWRVERVVDHNDDLHELCERLQKLEAEGWTIVTVTPWHISYTFVIAARRESDGKPKA